MSAKNNLILKTEHLTRNFGALAAVSDVSFSVPEGEFRAIIGPNGAGKTTLINLIVNLTAPTSGKVWFDDKNITNKKPFQIVRMGMCKTFQISQLFKSLTVYDNVKIACIQKRNKTFNLFPHGNRYLKDEVLQVLDYVDMQHAVDNIAGELSYGDQKRLEIAITLAMEPKMLLLDEPTAGVARQEGYAIMDMVRELAQDLNMTTVFIEHDMDIVFNYSDQISVMNLGELIATDTPENIRNNEFVQKVYLGGLS